MHFFICKISPGLDIIDVEHPPAVDRFLCCIFAVHHGGKLVRLPQLVEWINARFHATVYEDAYSPFCLMAGNNGDADVIHARVEEYCRGIPRLTVCKGCPPLT